MKTSEAVFKELRRMFPDLPAAAACKSLQLRLVAGEEPTLTLELMADASLGVTELRQFRIVDVPQNGDAPGSQISTGAST